MAGYDFMRKMYTRRIYPSVEGIRNSLRVLTLTNDKCGRLKAEELVDERIVSEPEDALKWLPLTILFQHRQ